MWTPLDFIILFLAIAPVYFVIGVTTKVVFLREPLSEKKSKWLFILIGSLVTIISMYVGSKIGE